MKTKEFKRKCTLVVFMLTALACSRPLEPVVPPDPGSDTKLRQMSFKVSGTDADNIAVFDGTETRLFQRKSGTDQFSGEAMQAAVYQSIAPWNENYVYNGEFVPVTIPDVQKAIPAAADPKADLRLGCTSDERLVLSPAVGYVRFTLSDAGVDQIELSGAEQEKLAGRADAYFPAGAEPGLVDVLGAAAYTKVVLQPAASAAELEPGTYAIAVLPVLFSSGCSLVLRKASDGKQATWSLEGRQDARAGMSLDAGTIPVEELFADKPQEWEHENYERTIINE